MDSRPSSAGQNLAASSSVSKSLMMSRSDSAMSQCRPLSLKPSPVKADGPVGSNVPRGSPLVIQCINCFTTSTWFSPSEDHIRRDPAADVPPPLSTCSRSTSSEPSSINTDFFPETALPSSNESACAKRGSTNLSDRLATPSGSDGRTPVVPHFKSPMSDCQVSPTSSWVGGKLDGVCSSCSFKSDPSSTSSPVATGASSLAPVPPKLHPYDSNVEALLPSHAVQSFSLLSGSLAPRYRRPVASTASRESPLAEASSPKDSDPNSQPPGTLVAQPLKLPVVVATDMLDKTTLKLSSLSRSNHLGLHHDNRKNSPLLPSVSIPFPLETRGTSCEQNSSVRKPNSLEPWTLNYSPSARTRAKSPRKLLREPDRQDMALELKIKGQGTTAPDPVERSDVVPHRGTNLRTLLREAKIPQSDSGESFSASRRPPIAVDMWQAAMISTPRDRLRNGDFPNWQAYNGTDSPFYQHLCGLSASSSSLSGKETLISTSVTSFQDNSLGGGSRSCSPPSDKHKNFDVHRRPSLGASSIADPFAAHAPERSPSLLDNSHHLLPSANESQEVLTGPSITKTARPTPSNVSLIARIANLHQNVSKSNKNNKRRPNTATGTSESTFIAKASPKPGSYGRSTPCPNTAGGSSSVMPSLLITETKVASAEPRVSNFNMYKRPATATCPGTVRESGSSLSNEFVIGRQFPISKLGTAKNAVAYAPGLPKLQGRIARDEQTELAKESLKMVFQTSVASTSQQEQTTLTGPLDPVPISQKLTPSPSTASDLRSSPEISQSVPNLLINHRSSSSKRNAFYAAAPLAATSDRLVEVNTQRSHPENPLRLAPEDFHSKSRYFTVSISPRPSSTTFSPGQRISVHVKLSNKAKVRKYTSIYLMLIGTSISDSDSPAPGAHDFLRHNYMIHPNPSEDVQTISHSGDLCEWHIELTIPGYANCSCQPGPLPLPSTGNHASGDVSYSLQLNADRKQILSNQESLGVRLHVITQAEARYQVTTQPFRTQSRKGRIPFAGGYLGAIEDLSLSHQVYYQSADRLRVGYQFELRLSSNSFLPPSIAEDVSRATKVEVHHLIKDHSKQYELKFTDHRSKVVVIPSDDRGRLTKWIVKGFLELKSVNQQMKAMKTTSESTPRTPRRLETAAGARSMLSSSHGSLSPTRAGMNHSLQQESERQAKLTSSQLFLTASIEHCPGVFTTPFEVSSLVGSELLSPCPLRKLGDEMMKRAVMAEKMKKVQEENSKNGR
ncbi:uncharacterized protein PGTG_03217 [Puccinia graminis f. sp. tritici CRL 75-36-700-3]|uniref:Uncharacterized protein n=1 Tax=Puccinia graminis f. sp. tritici (strain CRL 75-36-700-3 / race SCCL) TaxID=418459 RepID=E3JYY6_PUCGT|nr:uncharacterized protein PGTG_03217 [Puccinia graminis f. sp. tritici CRL 75-36-700-3]EFP77261.2 hypothetical protein PGTG_03217 [Puccinia graminis f. sp. tritici CRL 75-36-700-3]